MKKTLPSIRVEECDIKNIEMAIKKFNENNIVELSTQGFRRLSYKILSQMILNDEEIPLTFSKQ